MNEKKTHIVIDVEASIEGKKVKFSDRYVNEKGIFYFAEKSDYPNVALGMIIDFKLFVPGIEPITVKGQTQLETGRDGVFWNIKFVNISPVSIIRINKMTETNGVFPKWKRKNPRIPSYEELKNVPVDASIQHGKHLIIGSVENLSLGGVLIVTETPLASYIEFGDIISVNLQPRVDYTAINFKGKVVRINEELSLTSGNVRTYLGIQFESFEQEHKEAYLENIRKICEEIKLKKMD